MIDHCIYNMHAGICYRSARKRRAAIGIIGIIGAARKSVVKQLLRVIISYVTLKLGAAVKPVYKNRGDILSAAFRERLLLHDRTKRYKLIKRHIVLFAVIQHLIRQAVIKRGKHLIDDHFRVRIHTEIICCRKKKALQNKADIFPVLRKSGKPVIIVTLCC